MNRIVKGRKIAVMYHQQRVRLDQAAQLAKISIDDFSQLLIGCSILTPPADLDDDPDELVLDSLHASLQQSKVGKLHPVTELWNGINA